MKITEREMEERKERIVHNAFILFCEKGIEHVSIIDIARKSRVGETSVYRYFKNKPLLVLKTLTVLWKEFSKHLEDYAVSAKDFDKLNGYEQLKLRLEAYRRLYLDHSDYIIFSYEAKLYMKRHGLQLSEEQYDFLMTEIKDPCIEALNKGKADGSIKNTNSSVDLFYAIWGTIRGYIVKIVIYEDFCRDWNPWEKRYDIVEQGILSMLSAEDKNK